jgi:sugar phosphate isomerase/epimerase
VWETVGVNFEVIFAALHEISYRGYVSSLRSERLGRESMQLALEEMINL